METWPSEHGTGSYPPHLLAESTGMIKALSACHGQALLGHEREGDTESLSDLPKVTQLAKGTLTPKPGLVTLLVPPSPGPHPSSGRREWQTKAGSQVLSLVGREVTPLLRPERQGKGGGPEV